MTAAEVKALLLEKGLTFGENYEDGEVSIPNEAIKYPNDKKTNMPRDGYSLPLYYDGTDTRINTVLAELAMAKVAITSGRYKFALVHNAIGSLMYNPITGKKDIPRQKSTTAFLTSSLCYDLEEVILPT